MPKPSPRKLGKARDMSDSPDRGGDNSQIERSFIDGLDDAHKQKRRINKKILMEI